MSPARPALRRVDTHPWAQRVPGARARTARVYFSITHTGTVTAASTSPGPRTRNFSSPHDLLSQVAMTATALIKA